MDREQFQNLLMRHFDGTLAPHETAELGNLLQSDADLQKEFWAEAKFHALIRRSLKRSALAKSVEGSTEVEAATQPQATTSPQSLPVSALGLPVSALAPAKNPTRSILRSRYSLSQLAVAAALVLAVGMLAYTFWPGRAVPPAAQQAPARVPAAAIVSVSDAKWLGGDGHAGDKLIAGQRLMLQSGSAEIAFNSQAKLIVDGPAEWTIVDATACKLTTGKLTAHVPEPARGFKVHTPDGTVTDLGTEFGVYVKSEVRSEKSEVEEQQEGGQPLEAVKLPPITEVHVFKGQVDITTAQLSAAPESKIQNPKSKIVSAGQAVTISQQKVQPLPAADPFKFAIDTLNSKPRTVLLTDDFETYELGQQLKAVGPWLVQSGTRKGQGVDVIDPVQKIAQSNAEGFTPIASPPSLVGRRVAYIAAGAPNPPGTFPLLAREIDSRLLTQDCQVLVEFDVFLLGADLQHSLAFATEVGHTEGIELWRSADIAKQGDDAAKKIDVTALNWYRMRVLLDVANKAPRDVRVERSRWQGSEGWVRDLSFQPLLPKLDWSTPPRYVIFGYPVVTPSTPAGVLWIDNVRMEVITDK